MLYKTPVELDQMKPSGAFQILYYILKLNQTILHCPFHFSKCHTTEIQLLNHLLSLSPSRQYSQAKLCPSHHLALAKVRSAASPAYWSLPSVWSFISFTVGVSGGQTNHMDTCGHHVITRWSPCCHPGKVISMWSGLDREHNSLACKCDNWGPDNHQSNSWVKI